MAPSPAQQSRVPLITWAAVGICALVVAWPAAWITVDAMTCNGSRGTIGWFLGKCACNEPWSGPRCEQCMCRNGGTCPTVATTSATHTCQCPEQWVGKYCETCGSGHCTQIAPGTDDQCVGKCPGPCDTPPWFTEPSTGKCTRFCVSATTCSGHGTCANDGTCTCDDDHWSHATDDAQAQCTRRCADGDGCVGGAIGCSNDGLCLCNDNAVGRRCELPCPINDVDNTVCSGHGTCRADDTGTVALCIPQTVKNVAAFLGAVCQYSCPLRHDTGDVCGDDGTCVLMGGEARCRCTAAGGQHHLAAPKQACDTFCGGIGTFNGALGQCDCPRGFDPRTSCTTCIDGFSGAACQLHCDLDICGPHGTCRATVHGETCTCGARAHMDPSIISQVRAITPKVQVRYGHDARVQYSSPSSASTTMSIVVEVWANEDDRVAALACPVALNAVNGMCTVDNAGAVAMGPLVNTSDVPLRALPVATVGQYAIADPMVGARNECLARPTCVGYSSTAGITFDCAGKKCTAGTGLDTVDQNRTQQPLHDYLGFMFRSTQPTHTDLAALAPIVPTPAPTPYATRSPTPATARVQISTGRADVTQREASIVCTQTCDNNQATWDGTYHHQNTTGAATEPLHWHGAAVVCGCRVIVPTAAPTPSPTLAPTPAPTPSPTPTHTVAHMLGLGNVLNDDVTHMATGDIRVDLFRQAMADDFTGATAPLFIICNARTAVAIVTVDSVRSSVAIPNQANADDIATAIAAMVHATCTEIKVTLQPPRLLTWNALHPSNIPPPDYRWLFRIGESVPPLRADTVPQMAVRAVIHTRQGCKRCRDGWYPAPDTVGADDIEPCSVPCLANTTCHGNGHCNDLGQCICDTDRGQVWTPGSGCGACAHGFYPKPSRAEVALYGKDVAWCSSWCDPITSMLTIDTQVLAQFVPAGAEAVVIGCSGHGRCENGVNLSATSTEPPVRCVCDTAGQGGATHGFTGQFCDSSCGGTPICSGHGVCRAGRTCDCEPGHYGPSCEFGCTDVVHYRDSTTGDIFQSPCNALNTARGGVCEPHNRYTYPVTGAQITQQTCWLDGEPDADGNPNGAAAAECCGLPPDSIIDDKYRRVCNDTIRLQKGVYCNSTSNAQRGTCLRVGCSCHGSLAGDACDLQGCPFAVSGTAGFSACASALEPLQCQKGRCVPNTVPGTVRPGSADAPYTYDGPGSDLPVTPGTCQCNQQPRRTPQCDAALAHGLANYSAMCCSGPPDTGATDDITGIEVFHGQACTLQCGCVHRSTGTCSTDSDATGTCQCRTPADQPNSPMFCGAGCQRACPGVLASIQQLAPLCPADAAPYDSARTVDGCYSREGLVAHNLTHTVLPCNGHGKCLQDSCACRCLGFTTSTVFGAQYPTAQLFTGTACQYRCPGVTDELVTLAATIQASRPGDSSIQRTEKLQNYVTMYQREACNGHGYCGAPGTDGCTCTGGYSGTTCATLGCSTDVASSLSTGAINELGNFGYRACGLGTCTTLNECQCNDDGYDQGTAQTLWDDLDATQQATLLRFRYLLDAPCRRCKDNTYTSAFRANVHVTDAHLEADAVTLLYRTTCDLHITSQADACCAVPLLRDHQAVGQPHAGCPVNQCMGNSHVIVGAACDTCRLELKPGGDCTQRCARCRNAHHVLPVSRDAITVGMLGTGQGCAACIGSGTRSLATDLVPHDASAARRTGLCSGRGRCRGDPTTFGGDFADQLTVTPNNASVTTLCACDAGTHGGLCGRTTDIALCRAGGDANAILLPGGLCLCADYGLFGGPYCGTLVEAGQLAGGGNVPTSQTTAGVTRAPPVVFAPNTMRAVTCNDHGHKKSAIGACQHGPDPNDRAFCAPPPIGSAPAEPPCQCDDGYDAEVNCLDLTPTATTTLTLEAENMFGTWDE